MELSIITNSIIAILIAVLTMFIMLVFYKCPILLLYFPNKILCSMVVCEWFRSITVALHIIIEVSEELHDPDCHSCLVFNILVDIITSGLTKVATLHLCAFVFERYISVMSALKYNSIITNKLFKQILLSVWLIPLIASILQVIYLYPYIFSIPEQMGEDWILIFEVCLTFLSMLLFTALPILFMFPAYVIIFQEIRRLLKGQSDIKFYGQVKTAKKQLHAALCLLLMFVAFVLFTLPYFALRMYVDVMIWLEEEIELTHEVFNILYTIKNLTALCNPLIYTLMNRDFKRRALSLLKLNL
eukprot:TCONS_00054499-protein